MSLSTRHRTSTAHCALYVVSGVHVRFDSHRLHDTLREAKSFVFVPILMFPPQENPVFYLRSRPSASVRSPSGITYIHTLGFNILG